MRRDALGDGFHQVTAARDELSPDVVASIFEF